MTRLKATIAISVSLLAGSGCASLGYFDNSDFIDAINANPKQCRAAYAMLAKPFFGRTDELTHRGIWELNCGDPSKGHGYLTSAALEGDRYAKSTLIRHGLPLPDPMLPAVSGGRPSIDVYIQK